MILALIKSAHPVTPIEPLKPRFSNNSGSCLLIGRKQQHMLLTLSYLESAYPVTPVVPLKATLYDYFGISVYLFTLY